MRRAGVSVTQHACAKYTFIYSVHVRDILVSCSFSSCFHSCRSMSRSRSRNQRTDTSRPHVEYFGSMATRESTPAISRLRPVLLIVDFSAARHLATEIDYSDIIKSHVAMCPLPLLKSKRPQSTHFQNSCALQDC